MLDNIPDGSTSLPRASKQARQEQETADAFRFNPRYCHATAQHNPIKGMRLPTPFSDVKNKPHQGKCHHKLSLPHHLIPLFLCDWLLSPLQALDVKSPSEIQMQTVPVHLGSPKSYIISVSQTQLLLWRIALLPPQSARMLVQNCAQQDYLLVQLSTFLVPDTHHSLPRKQMMNLQQQTTERSNASNHSLEHLTIICHSFHRSANSEQVIGVT